MATLKVTAEHVIKAQEERRRGGNLSRCCPIAHALREQFPDMPNVYAHPDFLEVSNSEDWPSKRTRWEATATIRRFMREFDRTGSCDPHTFRLVPYRWW